MADLSILRDGLCNAMAAVIYKSWADNSGEEEDPQHKASALAGFVGAPDQWTLFEEKWGRDVLGRFELPYTHMKEFKRYEGPFRKFKDNKHLTIKLNQAMIGAICDSRLTPFACATRLADLRQFNAEHKRRLNDYSLNLYGCYFHIRNTFGNDIVQLVLDRTHDLYRKMHWAAEYAASHPRVTGLADTIQLIPLAETLSAKQIPALQAADFLAWEIRRDYTFKDGWFALRESADNYREWRASLFRFSTANDLRWPFHRGSLAGLARATKLKHIIWHYESLCSANDLRNGIWRPASPKRKQAISGEGRSS